MRKLITVIIAIALIAMSMPAFAGRAEDLQKRYAELVQQRIKINEELLRIEGAFSEFQRIEAEIKAEAEKIEVITPVGTVTGEIKAEKFEQQIIKTEATDKIAEVPPGTAADWKINTASDEIK